jgi:hypothetical protein
MVERHQKTTEGHSEMGEGHQKTVKGHSEMGKRHSEMIEGHPELGERHSETGQRLPSPVFTKKARIAIANWAFIVRGHTVFLHFILSSLAVHAIVGCR